MVVPCHKPCKEVITQFAKTEFERQRDYLIREYGLGKFNPRIELIFRTDAIASYGGNINGRPTVKICTWEVWPFVGTEAKISYIEDGDFSNDPGIGCGSANWKQHLAWTIAHEMAHAVVFTKTYRDRIAKVLPAHVIADTSAHGLFWQEVYRIIRVKACPESLYPIELLDMTSHVHYKATYRFEEARYVLYRGWSEVGRYVRDYTGIYRCNTSWGNRRPTRYNAIGDVVKRFVSV